MTAPFSHTDFFVLRTPLLPFDEFVGWSRDIDAHSPNLAQSADRLRGRLRSILSRAEVAEALFLASPALFEAMPSWMEAPGSERGQKIERSLVRYFSRMTARATPFGLMAGCTTGAIARATNLKLPPLDEYRRRTDLDMQYLGELSQTLGGAPRLRERLSYRPNSSLYQLGDTLRFVETAHSKEGLRRYQLVSAQVSAPLLETLARAGAGSRRADLAHALVQSDPELSEEEAAAFIEQLIAAQILVPDLEPAVTAESSFADLVQRLSAVDPDAAVPLAFAQNGIAALDGERLGVAVDRYRQLADAMGSIAKVTPGKLFHTTLRKPSGAVTLGHKVVEEIYRSIEALPAPSRNDGKLNTFTAEFLERYEMREVPLAEVLDEDCGLDLLDSAANDPSPLLQGLHFEPGRVPNAGFGEGAAFLLDKLLEAAAAKAQEIELTADELKQLGAKDPQPLPDSFVFFGTIAARDAAAVDRGEFRLFNPVAYGPSGAQVTARFARGDAALRTALASHLRREEALRPDVIWAEIVHLPEDRYGSIVTRPALRAFEIPFLAQSGVPPDRQVPIADLTLSHRNGRLVLRSRKWGKEVVPRLSCSHTFDGPHSLRTYRFLCLLQQSADLSRRWSWGPFAAAPFLPRVVCGKLVLCAAQWTLKKKQLEPLKRGDAQMQFARLQRLRGQLGLPRFIALADADLHLAVDLDNALSCDSFVHLVASRDRITVCELLPAPDELPVESDEGRFVHELVVPMVRVASAAQPEPSAPAIEPRARRHFMPGSDWLYVKLYAGTATADRILSQIVAPQARAALASSAASSWFFIRYDDTGPHLRVRFRGDPMRLREEVLAPLERSCRPWLEHGMLLRLELATYQREIERYGGDLGIEVAERIFHADSEAAVAIIDAYPGDAGLRSRWTLALAGIDRLLSGLEPDLAARIRILGRWRAAFIAEFNGGARLQRELAAQFRRERDAIDNAIGPGAGLQDGHSILSARSRRIAPHLAELLRLAAAGGIHADPIDIGLAYSHMWINRLLRSAQRKHELVLYDLLWRAHGSNLARGH